MDQSYPVSACADSNNVRHSICPSYSLRKLEEKLISPIQVLLANEKNLDGRKS